MRLRSLCDVAAALRSSSSSAVPLHSTRVAPKIIHHDVNTTATAAAYPAVKPPVIMLHGLLASASTYRNIMNRPDFAPDRQLIAIDLRNHGKSPHVPVQHGMTIQQMAHDVSTFLQAENIHTACLIGHSMGGKVAMQLALSQPDLVSQLVVVDIAPISYTSTMKSTPSYIATKAMRAINLEKVTSRQQVDMALRLGGVESEAVRQFVMTNLTASTNSSSKYQWRLNLHAIEAAFPHITAFPQQNGKTYTGPTCLIRGGKSNYVPFQAMKVFTQLFPNTKLVTISDAGHWLQAQAPDDFCRAVNDFLDA